MAIKTIWGYGSLMLTSLDGVSTVQFEQSIHSLKFNKQNIRQKAITGLLHQAQIMYRPIIQANITLCNQQQVQSLLDLIALLNQGTFYVMPQYDLYNNSQNNNYECYIDSQTIDFAHIANAELGQSLDITFIGRSLVKLPSNISNPETYNMIDSNNDVYIDNESNTLILNI